LKLGAEKNYLKAKIAGGANMFYKTSKISFYDIGNSNVAIVKKKLNELKVPLIAQDVGGYTSKTMSIDLTSLEIEIKFYEGNLSKVELL
jgi:chemotaxis protein CheD